MRELETSWQQSDTPGKAGGLMSGAASKAVTLVATFTQSAGSALQSHRECDKL